MQERKVGDTGRKGPEWCEQRVEGEEWRVKHRVEGEAVLAVHQLATMLLQIADDVVVLGAQRILERSGAPLIDSIHIGTGLDKVLDNVRLLAAHRHMERRSLVIVGTVHQLLVCVNQKLQLVQLADRSGNAHVTGLIQGVAHLQQPPLKMAFNTAGSLFPPRFTHHDFRGKEPIARCHVIAPEIG
jgi:hypothetical protein